VSECLCVPGKGNSCDILSFFLSRFLSFSLSVSLVFWLFRTHPLCVQGKGVGVQMATVSGLGDMMIGGNVCVSSLSPPYSPAHNRTPFQDEPIFVQTR
jgi:hypothetical protein